MAQHTPVAALIEALEDLLKASDAYADRFTELRRTDGMRDGGNGRRDRAILNFMSAEEHYVGRAEAARAAIAEAKARGEGE